MFTRCPACRTVFHITAAELRAAEGTVVCGACGTTFDALESLSEARPKDPLGREPEAGPMAAPRPDSATETQPEATPEAAPPAKPLPGAEVNARDEDEFLEELESLIGNDEAIPGEASAYMGPWDAAVAEWHDDAQPPMGDHEADDEADDEEMRTDYAEDEHLPPMAAAADPLQDEELAAGISTAPGAPGVDEADDEFDDRLPDPDSVFRVDDAGQLDDGDLDEESVAHFLGDNDGGDDDEGEIEGEVGDQVERAQPQAAGILAGGDPVDHRIDGDGVTDEADDETGPTIEDTDSAEIVPEFARESRTRRTWIRVLLVITAIGVLAITWAHAQHGKLLRHPTGAAVLGPVYELLGMDVAPDWDPADYRAVQWEAVATADQPGTLTVAVDFLNAATYPQPYPIIRIVLEDRFGRRVGTHDVAPAEYLPDHSPASRLPAGRRARTTVSVPDPGARADGFRVDFCLELPTRGLVCGPEPFR